MLPLLPWGGAIRSCKLWPRVERARQLLVTTAAIAIGIAGTASHTHEAVFVLGGALLVALPLCLALCTAAARTREHARQLIAEDVTGRSVPVVTEEQRRLASRKERERLARSLESYVRDATRWARLDPGPDLGSKRVASSSPPLKLAR